jgi:sensor histidine kinase regulating citrate/malate metabolism
MKDNLQHYLIFEVSDNGSRINPAEMRDIVKTPKSLNPAQPARKNLSNLKYIVEALKGKFVINSIASMESNNLSTFGIAVPVNNKRTHDC